MPFFEAGSQFLGFDRLARCGRPRRALPGHKIASIRITQHRLQLNPVFIASWDSKPRVHFDATLVRVTTDIGLVAYGSGAAQTCAFLDCVNRLMAGGMRASRRSL